MIVARSLLFNIAFYLNLILWMIAIMPVFLCDRRTATRAAQAWARSSIWLMRAIVGTRVEFRGMDKIPPGGLIVASKHQSLWETFALFTLFDDPIYILKRELMWIPLFGWYIRKIGMVPIDRKAGSIALTEMNARAREAMAQGRQILMFPEGTRRPAGAPPAYKFGISHLYVNLGVPCLPVALNAGLFWPRRKFIRRPGTIVVEIMDPIPAGLPRDVFFKRLQSAIETTSERLYRDGLAAAGLSAQETATTDSRSL